MRAKFDIVPQRKTNEPDRNPIGKLLLWVDFLLEKWILFVLSPEVSSYFMLSYYLIDLNSYLLNNPPFERN